CVGFFREETLYDGIVHPRLLKEFNMKKSIVFLLTGLALASTAPAHADGRLDKIKTTGEIALGHRDASIPFSYLDDKQQPIGYSMDICSKVVDAVKAKLGMEKINVKLVPVTSSTRIPL